MSLIKVDKIEKLDGTAYGVDDLSQAYEFDTVAAMTASMLEFPDGKRIEWLGYYAKLDGGSNWGVVKSGVHTDDGFSIFSIDATTYIEANLDGEKLSVKKAGAKGDGLFDDTATIQRVLDYIEGIGGGTAKLVNTSYGYRITSVLRIPSYTTLEGVAATRFPFQNETEASGIVCDFTDPDQWAVESKSKIAGSFIPHDRVMVNTDFNTATLTYNCCVKNVQINVTAGSAVPFGAVRMVASPGSIVDNVSAVGTGTGLMVNYCFGGNYSFHGRTLYYGTVIWGNANANEFEIYATQSTYLNTVPASYVMSFMNDLNGTMVASKLSTEDHYNRSFGVIVGGTDTDQSAGNKINFTIEEFGGSIFQYYAYGNTYGKFYAECVANHTSFGVVAAYSLFTAANFHLFLSGTGVFCDLGINVIADINAIGLRSAGGWGTGPWLDDSSNITLSGVRAIDFGPTTPQWNIGYPSVDQTWVNATLLNGWVNMGGSNQIARYRINQRNGNVELSGLVNSGVSGTVVFELPAGYRPFSNLGFGTQGASVNITNGGSVICYYAGASTTAWLDGVTFQPVL